MPVDAGPAHAPAAQPSAGVRTTGVVVALLVALVVLALIVPAALVRLAPGPMFWHAPEGTLDVEGSGDILFVDPPSGRTTAVYTFVNDAPLPVRIDRLPEYPQGTSVELLAYPVAGPDASFDPPAEPGRAAVTVGAGEVFAVRVHQRWPECAEFGPGSGLSNAVIELRATAFLVPRTVAVALEPQALLRTEDGRSAAGKFCDVVLHVG